MEDKRRKKKNVRKTKKEKTAKQTMNEQIRQKRSVYSYIKEGISSEINISNKNEYNVQKLTRQRNEYINP